MMVENKKYVLVTAAKNEEEFIEKPINAIINQTVLPLKWVIVSDGSTDKTNNIVKKYEKEYNFIQLLELERDNNRSFGAQVNAIIKGLELVKNLDYDFIGNIDADVSFENDYFENILIKFSNNNKLGLAGGTIQEKEDNVFIDRKTNNYRSVPNAIQLFRRKCFEDIKGYKPLKYGGHDVLAEYESRMHGWVVYSFAEFKVYHHRYTNTGNGSVLRQFIRIGRMDYSLCSHPLFEFVKCVKRITVKPYLIGAICRYSGYLWSALIREKRTISDELKASIKKDQLNRFKISRKSFVK